jgi:type VI secretion system secreted protein VgrG
MADSRLLSITTTLGPDAVVPTALGVTEALGTPYAIEVDVLGSDVELLPEDLLTKEITVTVEQSLSGSPLLRHFHGLVAEFERLGPATAGRMAYRLVAVPGIWRLSLKRNCRIFQAKSAKDIVETVLSEHGQPSPKWGILPTLEPIPYCTQFNETDLHFVSRLLEEHGMTYYFTHTANAHTLCISATAPGFPAYEGGDLVALHSTQEVNELSGWRRSTHARSALVDLHDMDGERSQPSVVLSKRSETRAYAGEPAMWSAGKVTRWPGGMSTRPGVDSAAVSMGAMEAVSENFDAQTLDPRFAAGARLGVAVRNEDGTEAKQQYVVTAVRHAAEDNSALNAGAGGTEHYNASLQLVAANRTWMPEPRHPRPMMAGLHSATVTGPSGEKIHVDEFGRIKVKFRWDTLGKSDDTSSCWVRVAQSAAGAWGGTWFLPRVGDEVLVAFLDGDPDRPIVTGSVYGKDAKPPFQPGSNRSQSGISTRSYKSDSANDANVLRFEDKKDAEEVLLHAQKDLTVEVENDEKRDIGHDQTEVVKNARTITIEDADDQLTLKKGSRTTLLEKGDRTTTLKQGNDTLDIDTGDRKTTLKKGSDSVELKVGNESHVLSKGNFEVKCNLGAVTIEAMQKITLKVGKNTVEISQMGITMKGMMITSEAQTVNTTKGLVIKSEAKAMVAVQGGIVMLN